MYLLDCNTSSGITSSISEPSSNMPVSTGEFSKTNYPHSRELNTVTLF